MLAYLRPSLASKHSQLPLTIQERLFELKLEREALLERIEETKGIIASAEENLEEFKQEARELRNEIRDLEFDLREQAS